MNKIKTLALLVMVLAYSKSFSQAAFEQGKSIASIGYGYQLAPAKAIYDQYKALTGFTSKGLGPLLLKYEYAVNENIGIGLSFSYTTANVNWSETKNRNGNDSTYTYNYKFRKITLTPRFNFHMGGDNEKFDPYIGFGLGMRSVKHTFTTNDYNFGQASIKGLIPISMELTFGARYLITPMYGIFTEIGIGPGILQFGGIAKF